MLSMRKFPANLTTGYVVEIVLVDSRGQQETVQYGRVSATAEEARVYAKARLDRSRRWAVIARITSWLAPSAADPTERYVHVGYVRP